MPYATTTQNAQVQPNDRGAVKFTIDELVIKAQSVSNHRCMWIVNECKG